MRTSTPLSQRLLSCVRALHRDERGQSTTEYVIILVGISIVTIALVAGAVLAAVVAVKRRRQRAFKPFEAEMGSIPSQPLPTPGGAGAAFQQQQQHAAHSPSQPGNGIRVSPAR